MSRMESALTQVLPFFALIGCGWAAGRTGLVAEAGVGGLTAFVFWFALPALLLRGLIRSDVASDFDAVFVLGWGAATLTTFAVGMILFRLVFKAGWGQTVLFGVGGGHSNLGFLGIPVIIVVMGEGAALPLSLIIAFDVVVGVGLMILVLEYTTRSAGAGLAAARAVALNPVLSAIVLGLTASFFGLRPPAPVDGFLGLLGAAAGPAALFALGASLAGRGLGEGRAEATTAALLKLVLHPILAWVALSWWLAVDPAWAKTAVLAAAMPIATVIFILGRRYDTWPERASGAVLISTALGMLTFSALAAFY